MRFASLVASALCIVFPASIIALGACSYDAPTASLSSAIPGCGDGLLETEREECDDMNDRNGDGCNWACQFENHDQCDAPILELGYEIVTITGSSANAIDNIDWSSSQPPCQEAQRMGPDMIYPVTPKEDGKLVATLIPDYVSHFLHVRTDCPGSVSQEVACDYGGTDDIVTANATRGSTLYVIVDSANGIGGSFSLQLELQK